MDTIKLITSRETKYLQKFINDNIYNFKNLFNIRMFISDRQNSDSRVAYLIATIPQYGGKVDFNDILSKDGLVYYNVVKKMFEHILNKYNLNCNNILFEKNKIGSLGIENLNKNSYFYIAYKTSLISTKILINKNGLKISFTKNEVYNSKSKYLSIESFINENGNIYDSSIINNYNDPYGIRIKLNQKQIDYFILLTYFFGNEEQLSITDELFDMIFEERYEDLNNSFLVKMMQHI